MPFQPRASQVFQPGSAVVHRIGVALGEVPSARTDLVSLGTFVGLITFTASSTADANGGALDPITLLPQKITIEPFNRTGYFVSATGADLITYQLVDEPCFWIDDDTLAATDGGGTRSFAGYVEDVIATGPWAGYVVLRSSAEIRALYELYSAGQGTPGTTSDGAARLVTTNIPAGAFSGGVWTATATGAFPTQDGVAGPLAVGDVLVFPLGTITTQVVAAADSGPYECAVVGATGVKAVFVRPTWFANGAKIRPHTTVRVGGEGTNYKHTAWVAKPATAAKVVGTDDPLMFPSEMIIPLTCSSGTATTALCPLRGAGLFAVLVDFTGGSPAATTTNVVASTQTPGGIGTASIVIQEQAHLGTLVATGSATATVNVRQ
jgi:hypothetical protein